MASSTFANAPNLPSSRDSQLSRWVCSPYVGAPCHEDFSKNVSVIADENAKQPGYPTVKFSMIHRILRAAWTLTRALFAQNGQVITIAWRGSNLSLCVIEFNGGKLTWPIQFFTVFFSFCRSGHRESRLEYDRNKRATYTPHLGPYQGWRPKKDAQPGFELPFFLQESYPDEPC